MNTAIPFIRPAETADLSSIQVVERDSFSDPWSLAMFEDLLLRAARGSAHVIVATVDGTVVGFAIAEKASPEVHVTNIAVDPPHRRMGIARQLMEEIIELAHKERLAEVWLEVREGNDAALRLYRSMGFVMVTRRRGYYRSPPEDALVMVLPLFRLPALHAGMSSVSLRPCV